MLHNNEEKTQCIAVIGLGYVGMPLAVAFARKTKVVGFDTNVEKIKKYQRGIDPTGEIGDEQIGLTSVHFTADENDLDEADFFIVAVPTPVNLDKTPDLSPVEEASRVVGRHLHNGTIVVYESTVYPGVTEEVCLPILQSVSGLVGGKDFKVGYSPERINPGDKEHRLENIKKIVSGMDEESLNKITVTYEMIIKAGVHRAPNIKVAEAAKVVENSQRDINIAFMNELAMVFDKMNICTADVIDAMSTKWNALNFSPGLVGGHCIGVDPYYFVYQAEKLGYHSNVIIAGRKINDGMGGFVADAAIKQLVLADYCVKKSRVGILGLTFKENCPDIRNSKVIDIIRRLQEYGIKPLVHDPYADRDETKKEYGIELTNWSDMCDMDCLILAVAHSSYTNVASKELSKLFNAENKEKIFIDVKSCFKELAHENSYRYWSL